MKIHIYYYLKINLKIETADLLYKLYFYFNILIIFTIKS